MRCDLSPIILVTTAAFLIGGLDGRAEVGLPTWLGWVVMPPEVIPACTGSREVGR